MEKEYICPMHKEVRQLKPGSCPICAMALEPRIISLKEGKNQELVEMQRRFWISLVLALPVFILAMQHTLLPKYSIWIQMVLTSIVVFYGAFPFFVKAIHSIKNLNMFTLIAMGIGAAYLYSLYHFFVLHGHEVYFEAASVITTLVLLGQVLELRTREKTGHAIKALLELTPASALRVKGDREEEVPIEKVAVGDILRVKPGGRVPLDGVITSGSSTVDESMMTGEWMPVEKSVNSSVIGGTLNQTGSFLMQVSKVSKDTLLSKVIQMVAEARNSSAPIQRLVDKVASYFVPLVLLIALLTLVVWSYFGMSSMGIMNAIAVIIIACPCALGLAAPMSIMVGIGKGASQGILMRDAASLEKFSKVNLLIVDKTGTLTEGRPNLVKVKSLSNASEDEFLQIAASIASLSEHPLSTALVEKAKEKKGVFKEVEHFSSETGKGISGKIEGRDVLLGALNFMQENHISTPTMDEEEILTYVYLAIDHKIVAYFGFKDPIKESAKEAIEQIHKEKIRIAMLSGDQKHVARAVGRELNIDEIQAPVLPEEKEKSVAYFQNQGYLVAMAGDGINDAPALAKADIGIAMGSGTHVAMESAKVVLVKGDLRGIVRALKLSSAIRSNIKQNLFLAFCYNILAVPIAAGVFYPLFGFTLNPMIASGAMILSSLSVVGNALRLSIKNLN